jgi:hypothetical protein
MSDRIRRARKERVRELEIDREYRDDWDYDYHHRHRGGGHRSGYEDERIHETEVIYESRPPVRGYIR